MLRKIFATLAIGVLTALAVPTAASAYAPGVNVTVSGDAAPGGTVTIVIADGTFTPGENVNVQVSGFGTVSFGSGTANGNSVVITANGRGGASVAVTLPRDARGSYNVTATGLASGTIVSTAITVPTADRTGVVNNNDDDNLAFTGSNGVSMLAIWTASGLALFGIALVVVRNVTRRQRADA